MKSLWREAKVRGKSLLDQLVYRSRLIGSECSLCLLGGGNTSTKTFERDKSGRLISVLWVKGAGRTLKESTRKSFSPLRLDMLRPLLNCRDLPEPEMYRHITRAKLNPESPKPSIETLLHTFLPFQDIDHSHADAILSVTNTKNGKRIANKIFGKRLLWIPFIKSGFPLAKKVHSEFQKNPQAEGALLEKHGIITWGNSSKESYLRMIQFVSLAEKYIQFPSPLRGEGRVRRKHPFGRAVHKILSHPKKEIWLRRFLPILKSSIPGKYYFRFETNRDILEFVNSEKSPALSQIGPATPAHMLRTGWRPLFVRTKNIETLRPSEFVNQIQQYRQNYEKHFRRFKKPGLKILDAFPKIMLIPGIGLVARGETLKEAKQAAEIYHHSIQTMRGAETIDSYASITAREAFDLEYWVLQFYKLASK